MIIRIVKMEFEEKRVQDFLDIFNENREAIRSFPGCTHLQLLQDTADPRVFFTYSHWNGESDLHRYRDSGLFKSVWGNTRKLFSAKAAAWSLSDQTDGAAGGLLIEDTW